MCGEACIRSLERVVIVKQIEPVTASPVRTKERKKKRRVSPAGLLVYTVLVFWALTTIFPLAWVANNSFKTSREILTNSLSITTSLRLENFISVFGYGKVGKALSNSFIISGSVVFFTLFLGGFAAFALSRFDFKYKGTVKTFLYAGMLVPQFAIIVPVFWILREIKVYGSYFALIIPQTAANISFAVIVLMGFMVTIPKELEEAALVEGAGIPMIFFRVIVPISVPAFATTAILIFLWSYNDLLLSLVYLPQKNLQPICVVLSNVSSMFSINYGAMMAAVFITILPVLILYAFSQKYVIKGMTAGALKG